MISTVGLGGAGADVLNGVGSADAAAGVPPVCSGAEDAEAEMLLPRQETMPNISSMMKTVRQAA